MTRVEIDQNRCQSIAMCNVLAPDVFLIDDDGVNQIIGPVTDDGLADVEEAVAACPAFALRLLREDDQT